MTAFSQCRTDQLIDMEDAPLAKVVGLGCGCGCLDASLAMAGSVGLRRRRLLWVVWYFTKSHCTMDNADAGLCNAGFVAGFINHQILAQAILLGLAVAAVKGGYDELW